MPTMPKRDPARSNSPGWTALAADPSRRAPGAPDWLDQRQRRTWRALWRSPIGALWDPLLDAALVADWFLLRNLLAESPEKAALHGQLRAVEDRLCLSPRARMQMRVDVGTGGAAPPAPAAPRERPDPRLRAVR